jgi:predicted phosphodiesterase
MRIALISDLHMGADPRVDQFGHRDDEFLHFLDYLERTHEAIVLNGDIWQCDQGRSLFDQGNQLDLAMESHPKIANRFRQDPYVYVAGNHDLMTTEVLGVPQHLDWELDGLRIHITHGHLHDPVLLTQPGIDRFGSWINGWVERLGFERAAVLFERIDRAKFVYKYRGVMLNSVNTLLESCEVVAMGHTHLPCVEKLVNGWYVNSGTCFRGQYQWATIDTSLRAFDKHVGFGRSVIR